VQWLSAIVLFWAADPRLIIPLVAWLMAYGVALAWFIPLIRKRSTEASEARSTLLGRLVDSYTNILTVKLFAHADNEEGYARAALEEQIGKHQSFVRLTTVMAAILSALNGLLIAATTAVALWLWTSGLVSLGAIALVTTLVVRITQMSGWVLNLVTSIFENIGIVQDGMETISRPQAIVDQTGAKSLVVRRGEIRFDAIGFNYGSAKGTSLLHRSVLDNLVYGRPEGGLEGAIEAAKRANAHEFIDGLEDADGRRGYQARVGERGVKLSGGQRQRIAIARVLLKDAPILILDEATSALDSEAEAAIQEQLLNLMSGKTVIAIAHRLSTIAAMDRLIVLDHGRILEEGGHRDLLRRGGLYAELWARQSGSFMAK
jgi:ABC-type multidrug transport system fused ATPase/permease subunit